MCLSIATDAVCCAGSSFCTLACCCCKACLGTTFKEQVKLTYILLNYFVMIFTVLALYYISEMYSQYIRYIGCPIESGGSDICLGVSGVYRMSFILCTLYFLLIFMMLFRGQFAREVNEGLWGLKILFIIVGFYGSLYIPNSFFEYYVDLSSLISGGYMLFQIIIYIDIFYKWAENWIQQYDDGIEGMGIVLIVTTIILFGITIIFNIYNIIWFEEYYMINVITILLIIIQTVIQMQGFNQQGSLLVSSALALYITFQVFSALSSLPDKDVNIFYSSKKNIIIQMIIGAILNFGALIYLIFATMESSKQQLQILDKQEEKIATNVVQPMEIELTHDQRIIEAKSLIEEDSIRLYRTNCYVIYHFIMLISVIYMGMMITNWGAPNINERTQDIFKLSWISYYVKLFSSWICSLLYIWTLVAPRLYPERF